MIAEETFTFSRVQAKGIESLPTVDRKYGGHARHVILHLEMIDDQRDELRRRSKSQSRRRARNDMYFEQCL